MVYPLLWLIASAFKPEDQIFHSLSPIPSDWVFSNFSEGWNALRVSFTRFFANSFLIAGLRGDRQRARLLAHRLRLRAAEFPPEEVLVRADARHA